MTDRELLKQALEALVLAQKDAQIAEADYAITALRERLAQPEQEPQQEPVAWNLRYNRYPREGDLLADIHLLRWQETLPQSLNTPPRREWVGLTDTDIEEVWADENLGRYATSYAIEAKLKEKNA